MPNLQCSYCHTPIGDDVHPYTMKVEIYPRLEESLQFTSDDLESDFDEEIQKIIQQLESLTDAEAKLEEERVYSSFSFTICPACRDFLAKQFRHSSPAP